MTIEEMYQNYLSKVGLDESTMSEVQKKETKRSFFAGISSMLEFWLNSMDRLDTEKAVLQLDEIHKECIDFWKKEIN